MSSEELEPCPFCPDGGKPEVQEEFDFIEGLPRLQRVSCIRCGSATTWYWDRQIAVLAWNKRSWIDPNRAASMWAKEYWRGKRDALAETLTCEGCRNFDGDLHWQCDECSRSKPDFYARKAVEQ